MRRQAETDAGCGAMSWGRWLALAICGGALVVAACSLDNQEGPEMSCAELDCGRVNACENGIIAQCLDGHTVRYHVCEASGDDVCGEDWQQPGQYRCQQYETDCEGCRPERVGGCADITDAGTD